MGLVDTLKVHAMVAYYAAQAQLTPRQYRVLLAVLSHLLRWQRLQGDAPAALLARFAGVHKADIGGTLAELHELGFIEYSKGKGRTPNRVRVLVPDNWAEIGPWVSAEPADSVDSADSAEAADPDSADSADPETAGSADPDSADSAVQSGGFFGRTSTGVSHGGGAGQVQRVAQERPHPEHVLGLVCEALDAAGTPLPNSLRRPLLRGIGDALSGGNSVESVLLGLGWWLEEGFHNPKQVAEMTFKALARGGHPAVGLTPEALLSEGQRRFIERASKPSVVEVRRAQSARAISRFLQGQG